MKIALEKIIEIVTREVIKELLKKGIDLDKTTLNDITNKSLKKSYKVDMSAYKTPILTEMRFEEIGSDVNEIIIPAKTIITPGANYIINKSKIKVIYT